MVTEALLQAKGGIDIGQHRKWGEALRNQERFHTTCASRMHLSMCMLMAALMGAAVAFPAAARRQLINPPDMTVVKPETVGFSSERLERPAPVDSG